MSTSLKYDSAVCLVLSSAETRAEEENARDFWTEGNSLGFLSLNYDYEHIKLWCVSNRCNDAYLMRR